MFSTVFGGLSVFVCHRNFLALLDLRCTNDEINFNLLSQKCILAAHLSGHTTAALYDFGKVESLIFNLIKTVIFGMLPIIKNMRRFQQCFGWDTALVKPHS